MGVGVVGQCLCGRGVSIFQNIQGKKTFKLRFQLYLRIRVNSFAKTIVLEDKNIVLPLSKVE
jgi:hypothetical protein